MMTHPGHRPAIALLRYVALSILISLCGAHVRAGHIRPEVMAYNRALLEIEDRADLLTTVIELSGESPETARELAGRLLHVDSSRQWALDTIAEYMQSEPRRQPDASLVVALAIQPTVAASESSGEAVPPIHRLQFLESFYCATSWHQQLDWIRTTPLPAIGKLKDVLTVAGMHGPLDAKGLAELSYRIDMQLAPENSPNLSMLNLLLLIHLDQTGDLSYVESIWSGSFLSKQGDNPRRDAILEPVLKNIAAQLVLSCTIDSLAARNWGLLRVEEIESLLDPDSASFNKYWGQTLMVRFIIPFARLHPRTSPVQELARRSLRPESPLYPYRVQLIPLLAYNFEYLPETEFDELRWETLMRARREARDVLGALDVAIEAYPRREDADTTGSVSQAAPTPAD